MLGVEVIDGSREVLEATATYNDYTLEINYSARSKIIIEFIVA